MNLYLKHGKKLSTVSAVHLKDFHTPSVGHVEINHTVEPAIWFKTLIIDSMLIDCDARNVYWRERSPEHEGKSELDSESMPRMSRAVYDEGDCDDFELFDAVTKFLNAIENNKSFSEGKRAQEVLRILHLYVLPEIVLKTQDVCLLQNALETVEQEINSVSADIQSKDCGIALTEKSLRNQRDKMFSMDNFESEKYLNTCKVQFLAELLLDIVKDISFLNYDLEASQSEVDRLREAITDEGQKNLLKARQKRDELFTLIEKYQAIRETIKNVTVRSHAKKRKKVQENVFHEIYLELKTRLKTEKQLVKHSCDQKLKMTSVREAIVQVRDELLQKEESYGFETSRDGQGTSTDVLEMNNNRPSNWHTVEQQVKSIIHDDNSGLSLAFKSFCESINAKITALIKENELFQCSSGAMQDETRLKHVVIDGDEFVNISYMEGLEDKSLEPPCNDRISSGYRLFTHTIKEDVLKHIEAQTRWLLDSMETKSFMEKGKHVSAEFPNKVWICYEAQLYNHIMTSLSHLYCVSYLDVASKLNEFISQKTLLELEIDEPWLNDDFANRPRLICPASGTVSVATKLSSLKSGLSLTLGRMTLEELYQSANKGCEGIPDILDCPLDETNDVFDLDIERQNDRRQSVDSIDEDSILYTRPCESTETVAEIMQPVCLTLKNCIQTIAVVEKLKSLTRAYRLVNRTVCKLKGQYRRDSVESMVCCDEILSASIVLLTLLKKEEFVELYSHLNLMIDLMPSFLTGSVHDCSLTNFYSAFQYLFDKQVSVNRVSR